jgi:hypothetical protein
LTFSDSYPRIVFVNLNVGISLKKAIQHSEPEASNFTCVVQQTAFLQYFFYSHMNLGPLYFIFHTIYSAFNSFVTCFKTFGCFISWTLSCFWTISNYICLLPYFLFSNFWILFSKFIMLAALSITSIPCEGSILSNFMILFSNFDILSRLSIALALLFVLFHYFSPHFHLLKFYL